jgi:hypothetical protein
MLALIVLHVVCKTVDVGASEFRARQQIRGALQNDFNFFWQFVFWFLLAAHKGGLFTPVKIGEELGAD